MTDQIRQILVLNRKAALESGDMKRIADADHAISDALLECQAHTADRIKRIESRVEKIDTTLDAVNTQMTEIATSRALLTEKYDATVEAIGEVKSELSNWKAVFAYKKNEQERGANGWLSQLMSNSGFQFFVLLVFLIGAFVYLCTGKGGTAAGREALTTVIKGGM